jgi:uncharacterized cupredoxin-like copper-binding protein
MLVTVACGAAPETVSPSKNSTPQQTEATDIDMGRLDDPGTDPAEAGHDDEADDEADSHGEAGDVGEHGNDAETGSDDESGHSEDAVEDDELGHAADRVVEVSMTDLAFSPDVVDVVAGETITFAVANDGAIVHEFRLSNPHRIEEHLASGHEDHDDGGGHHGDADIVLQLEPGETGNITVTFPEDVTFFTEIACLIPGHYEAGMKGLLRYQ